MQPSWSRNNSMCLGFLASYYGGLPNDVSEVLARFRNSIPGNFDHDYVEHAVTRSS
jgi:hypothetical protein